MNIKKTLAGIASYALVGAVALGVGGTLATQHNKTATAANVQTVGPVEIAQLEYERVVDNTGNWVPTDVTVSFPQADGTTDEYVGDKLQKFTQGKPMSPAYYADGSVKWDDREGSQAATGAESHQQPWAEIGAPGSNQLFDDSISNVLDKFVFVENTGGKDVYVRTVFAFEAGKFTAKDYEKDGLVHLNRNGGSNWSWTPFSENMKTNINGTDYYLTVATYTRNNGIVEPEEITRPSLLQVFFDPAVENEHIKALGDTYDILVISQAVQADLSPDLTVDEALNVAFDQVTAKNHPWNKKDANDNLENELPTFVNTAEELTKALDKAGLANAGSNTIYITSDIDMANTEWTPIYVDGYHGADVITIEGCGNTISGLSAPLFKGGFAGESGIVIKGLTIADSEITSTNTLGSGAFIESVDSMQEITLIDCHLLNSTVIGGKGSRTGGLIGWTAGYNNVNDGPVKTYVTIEDCSVIGNTITCDGSVGGINGHAGNNAWTYTTIKNCTVQNNKLISTDDGGWRVGVVVGTANVGEVTIENITESNNTLTQTGKTAPQGQSNLYGRFVPDKTGKLIIDGVEITN